MSGTRVGEFPPFPMSSLHTKWKLLLPTQTILAWILNEHFTQKYPPDMMAFPNTLPGKNWKQETDQKFWNELKVEIISNSEPVI